MGSMMRCFGLLFLASAALLLSGAAVEGQQGFRIVAHKDVPINSLSKEQASKLLLKKVTRWDNGPTVVPVDLEDSSPVRQAFTRQVHNRSVGAIKSYWQRQIFSGRGIPPAEKTSDREVLRFVAAERGAIGYVSAGAAVGGNIKVIQLTN